MYEYSKIGIRDGNEYDILAVEYISKVNLRSVYLYNNEELIEIFNKSNKSLKFTNLHDMQSTKSSDDESFSHNFYNRELQIVKFDKNDYYEFEQLMKMTDLSNNTFAFYLIGQYLKS